MCAVSVKDMTGDKLHISSTDLHSWTTSSFPYHFTTITTYQSKFVAVGGCDFSTVECTNKLWTSDTGHDWQPSLPPMPTKRAGVSAVSIGSSPQYLVVAGGLKSPGTPLSVVEVLVGEQWTTVAHLPEPCCTGLSTLHDGNLYIMKGDELGYSIFTCKCNSLCEDAKKNSPTSRALWSEFEAPEHLTNLVSFGQRLISIGEHSTIRAYSSMSQSWVEVFSQDNNYECGIAGVVLPTGELMVDGTGNVGAYKVTLSGERYVLFVIVLYCDSMYCSKLLYNYFLFIKW